MYAVDIYANFPLLAGRPAYARAVPHARARFPLPLRHAHMTGVKLAYTIDAGMWRFVLPEHGAVATIDLIVPALYGTRTHHELKLALYSSDPVQDRWRGATTGSAYLTILGTHPQNIRKTPAKHPPHHSHHSKHHAH